MCNVCKCRLVVFVFLFAVNLFTLPAQQFEKMPFRTGFSSVTDNQQWMLNAGNSVNFENLWYIAPSGDSDGNMLYISGDKGVSPSYTSKDNIVVSYRTFDMQAGTYDLAFDWKALGRDSSNACMFVVWCPESYTAVSRMVSLNFYTTENDFPLWMKTYKLYFDNGSVDNLFGCQDWTHATTVLNCPVAGKYRLAFVWVNKHSDIINLPAGCVDNLEIASASCGKPRNLKCLGSFSSVTFSWEGSAAEYEMKYSIMDENKWTVIQNINQNSVVVNNLPQDIYEVRLRSICGNDTSIWEHFPMTFVYETQCLDFLDLKSAYCTHGDFDDPYKNIEYVDKGYKSIYSNHTIHYRQDEYDARTLGQLKTVPDGALASVRLGNWGVYRKAESITYNYRVDAKYASVLLLKYAVVMEDPGHSDKDQPRFKLEILDEQGNLVDLLCGSADFRAKSNVEGWITIPAGKVGSSPIVWKNWTTVGLNLEQYDGDTLKIRLTTYDCNASGHYGYAYFTIGCTTGEIEGMNCGDYPTTEFIAPEGFNYRWYTEQSVLTDTLSKERVFEVDPSDRTHYLVDVIYPTESQCKFTLKASAIPRFPKAGMVMKHTPKECRNFMTFSDTSCIVTDEGIAATNVDAVSWNFGNGRIYMDTSVVVEFPVEGYTHDSCYLVASLCSDLCTDTFWFSLNVPSLIIDTVHNDLDLCIGDTLYLFGDTVTDGGKYTYDCVSQFSGCDSVVVYHVLEHESYMVYDTVSIVNGEEYEFGEDVLKEAGDYEYVYKTIYGCDSVVLLHLNVLSLLDVELLPLAEICHDQDSILVQYDILEGCPQKVNVVYSEYARFVGGFENIVLQCCQGANQISLPMPDTVLPDKYNVVLEFSDGVIGTDTISVELDVKYASSVLTQRWNDVIAVRNDKYNGGFVFSHFQWFVDNEILTGETESQLYKSGGLDFGKSYCVLLTRVSDGVSQFTCPFYPNEIENISDQPTIYFGGDTYSVSFLDNPIVESILLRLYSLDGAILKSVRVYGVDASIELPSASGVYLLEIIAGEDRRVEKIVVRN